MFCLVPKRPQGGVAQSSVSCPLFFVVVVVVLAALCALCNLSSATRDGTWAPSRGSTEF